MREVKIYARFERFWHWTQALLIVSLGVTGFEIHGTFTLFGFEQAVELHGILSWALIVLFAFAIFWHLTTGAWKQYIPTTEKLADMVRYYGVGIFRNESHPVKKTELSKLNPLQRLTYLVFKLMIAPVMVGSGLLYLYYNDWAAWGLDGLSLTVVALVHVAGAFVLLAFFLVHVYMTTTGRTVFSNIKAMITGWEKLDDEVVEK